MIISAFEIKSGTDSGMLCINWLRANIFGLVVCFDVHRVLEAISFDVLATV